MEIPGVGPLCALSFYSAIEDPSRFSSAADVGAYLGLVPRRHQSGEASRSIGITKTGSKLTRQHLVTSALVMKRCTSDCALRDWGVTLKARIGAGRAKVAVARKLAIVMLNIWKTGARFEPYPTRAPAQPSANVAAPGDAKNVKTEALQLDPLNCGI